MGVVLSECIWKSGCGIHRQMPMSMGNSNREYEYECLHNNKTEVINLNDFWYYDSITVLDVDV